MSSARGILQRARFRKKADPIVVEDTASAYVLHGMTGSGAITEPCPNCLYAYADGGYCPDCGWMKPIKIDSYGSHTGRRF